MIQLKAPKPLVFVDAEMTGLIGARRLDSAGGINRRGPHRIWELAAIRVEPGREPFAMTWMVQLPDSVITEADPKALEIGRFHERHPQGDRFPYGIDIPIGVFDADRNLPLGMLSERYVAHAFGEFSRDAVLIGANIGVFDVAEFLKPMMETYGVARHGGPYPWDYHLVEVESYAAGAFGVSPPWSLDALLQHVGIEVPEADRHTALGDTRAGMQLFYKAQALRPESI